MTTRMTNEQIDELNELWADHGEVIAAFAYEAVDKAIEAYGRGRTRGFVCGILPVVCASAGLLMVSRIIVKNKTRKKTMEES